jgi:hypothetical protein
MSWRWERAVNQRENDARRDDPDLESDYSPSFRKELLSICLKRAKFAPRRYRIMPVKMAGRNTRSRPVTALRPPHAR